MTDAYVLGGNVITGNEGNLGMWRCFYRRGGGGLFVVNVAVVVVVVAVAVVVVILVAEL